MVSDILQSLMGGLHAHPYLFLFAGLLLAGETILLPAIFLGISGTLALVPVLLIAIAATMLSDLVWYAFGRRLPRSAIRRLPGRGTSKLVDGLDRLFTRRGAQLVFLSKFVYGTRVVAQLLAGVHDMPVRRYLVANTLGVVVLTLLLCGLAWSTAAATSRVVTVAYQLPIAFAVFVALAAIGYLVAAGIARRQWSR